MNYIDQYSTKVKCFVSHSNILSNLVKFQQRSNTSRTKGLLISSPKDENEILKIQPGMLILVGPEVTIHIHILSI